MQSIDAEPLGLEHTTTERVVQTLFDNRGLHVVHMEPPQRGAFSQGRVVAVQNGGAEQQRFFLKQPTDVGGVLTDTDLYNLLLNGRQIPHVVTTRGVLGVHNDAVLHPLHSGQTVERVYMVQDALPADSIKLTVLLEQLGLVTAQTDVQTGLNQQHIAFLVSNLGKVYENIMVALADIHKGQTPPAHRQQEMYQKALQDIIINPIRLDGIAAIYFGMGQESALNHERFIMLRDRMQALAQAKSTQSHRIRPVHGDPWGPNIFIGEKMQPHLIDPAIAFSDPALDVVFSTADIAHIAFKDGVDTANSPYLALADSLVDRYAQSSGDFNIRSAMALFYGFKGFVRAVFDARTEEARMQAYCGALGAVSMALQNPSFQFRFTDIPVYAKIGRGLL